MTDDLETDRNSSSKKEDFSPYWMVGDRNIMVATNKGPSILEKTNQRNNDLINEKNVVCIKELVEDADVNKLKTIIRKSFQKNFNITFIKSGLNKREKNRVKFLKEKKYSNDEWNYNQKTPS